MQSDTGLIPLRLSGILNGAMSSYDQPTQIVKMRLLRLHHCETILLHSKTIHPGIKTQLTGNKKTDAPSAS